MIKATELRIGNLVSNDGDIMYIEVINEGTVETSFVKGNAVYEIVYADISGIPLTEEWLIKFGFDAHQTVIVDTTNYIKGDFHLNSAVQIMSYKNEFLKHCKYVHQLQNLYYALTGSELTLKP